MAERSSASGSVDYSHLFTPPVTPPQEKGFFSKILGNLVGSAEAEVGKPQQISPDVTSYWQNYDLSTSAAPDLFEPDVVSHVQTMKSGLNVMLMRMRIQKRIAGNDRKHKDRAAARIQALARQWLVRQRLPELVAAIDKHIKLTGNIR